MVTALAVRWLAHRGLRRRGAGNLMCAAQAAAVLLGLAVIAIWPAGWPIDPVIALGIAAWSVWEGRQAWRGDDCC